MNRKLILVIIGLNFLIGNSLFAQDPLEIESLTGQAEGESSSGKEIRLAQRQGYTLDLRELLKKAEESIKKVEGEIEQQEIRERNIDREAKIRECFRRGKELSRQGKLKEAKEEWEKIIALSEDPEMSASYIEESARRVEIEQLFGQVNNLWKIKDYGACQPLLEKILELDEGNQEAKKLLADLPKRIAQREREKKEAQARPIYEEALSLYRDKNYQAALEKFEQINSILLDYKKTNYYLNRIPQDIQKEKERPERKRQRELEKQQREKQRQLEKQMKEEERRQREEIRKQKERQERLEKERKERIEKSKKTIQDAKETAMGIEEKTRLRLENLTYKTERECLDALGKYPDDKEVFNNLVNLYLLRDELLNKAEELYKNEDYQGAIQEYNKVLLIEPENKKAKMGIKRARSRMK